MVYQPILGAGTSQCIPKDVSGSQRHLFFSSQTGTLSHSDVQFVLQNESEHYDEESVNKPIFTNNGTQTNNEEYWKAKRIHKILISIKCKERDITEKANMRRKQHQENKRKEESLLPHVTDKESLMAYKIFLEDNEKKEFMIREEELEEQMKLKYDMIVQSLHARYKQGDALKEQRIEAMRQRSKHSKRTNKRASTLEQRQSSVNVDMLNEKARFTDHHSIEKLTKLFQAREQKPQSMRESTHHRNSIERLHSNLY